ncbi:MAG: hypothetical protein IKO03_05760 [Lachnospiraceae bacterium]|nr:hypothetical protein [Lachnospiraceae bacterium]
MQYDSSDRLSDATLKRILKDWEEKKKIVKDKDYGFSLREDIAAIHEGCFSDHALEETLSPSIRIPKATSTKKTIVNKIEKTIQEDNTPFLPKEKIIKKRKVGIITIANTSNKCAKRISDFIDASFSEEVCITKYEMSSTETGKLEIII